MLNRLDLSLPFRGRRTYLHSTHIIGELVKHLPAGTPIKLEMRAMAENPITLSDEELDPDDRVGTFSFTIDGKVHKRGLYVERGKTVEDRVACNESEIIERYDHGQNAGEGMIGQPGTLIETIVALNKAIVARNGKKGGKVLFSVAALNGYADAGTVRVELSKQMADKLFVSNVILDGKPLGSLTFMVV